MPLNHIHGVVEEEAIVSALKQSRSIRMSAEPLLSMKIRAVKKENTASPIQSNTPRRLRFRPAKATDNGSRNKDPTRDSITRSVNAEASSHASGDSGASRAEVVVLRRQDAEDRKKNKQGLFNSVIEEAVSRLVEARKSKVKALVGAFETVISLQEKQAKLQLHLHEHFLTCRPEVCHCFRICKIHVKCVFFGL